MSSLFEHIRMHWIGFNSFKHSYNWYSNFGVFFKSKHLRWKKNDLLYLNRDDTPVIWYRTKIKFINHFICMTYFLHFPARKQIYLLYLEDFYGNLPSMPHKTYINKMKRKSVACDICVQVLWWITSNRYAPVIYIW